MPFPPKLPTLRPFHRLVRETVHAFRVFTVERLRAVPPWKDEAEDFHVIGSRDFVNILAVTDENEMIFVWQYRFGTEAMSLETPGGLIDEGESPEAAARRELLEETGYVAETIEPLLIFHANPALQASRCHVFLARGARPSVATRFDEHEECELALVPASRLSDLVDDGHVTHGLIVAALEYFLRRQRSASPAPLSTARTSLTSAG